jgi:hypothetical protein
MKWHTEENTDLRKKKATLSPLDSKGIELLNGVSRLQQVHIHIRNIRK